MNSDILINPLIVAGISALLAALIGLIDTIVNNYGEVAISINDGAKNLPAEGGRPLLFTLAENGLYVPSACGGRGSCGACKVTVKSDIGPVYPTELPFLTREEIKENIRLSCQVKVKSDLEIAVPEELFNVKQFSTIIESMTDVTHDIKEIKFRLSDPKEINYSAGQYVQLEVPPYGKISEPTQRAYSMSSCPADKDYLELLIRLVPGGTATTYVFENMKVGDTVNLYGPFGDFMVRETDAVMLCVAGGSGMAPIKSILYDMLDKGKTDREVWYFFGARTREDLFYEKEFKELEEKWPSFHFIPALSQPLTESSWTGETGLITDVMDKYLSSSIKKELPREGYLCGSPGMINACIEVMKKHGVTEDKIYYDSFA